MITGKLFNIDYSRVPKRHEFPNKHLAAKCLMQVQKFNLLSTTGFDIDYSRVWNRCEYEFQILVGGNFFEILKNRKCWTDCFTRGKKVYIQQEKLPKIK